MVAEDEPTLLDRTIDALLRREPSSDVHVPLEILELALIAVAIVSWFRDTPACDAATIWARLQRAMAAQKQNGDRPRIRNR